MSYFRGAVLLTALQDALYLLRARAPFCRVSGFILKDY